MQTRNCTNLETEIADLTDAGYRLDMIVPADSPRIALLSRNDEQVKLVADRSTAGAGRAGMEYRDLVPDRIGGFLIASHIRIPDGGEVADYVHYHKLLFQMIYCRSGWVRVVYEGQGPPFVMNTGDCVLQPPEIRHRVLESSAGAEVIEVSCPSGHETWVDHELRLPTPRVDRTFRGQRFVRHIGSEARWRSESSLEYVDTGIASATAGAADVRVIRTIGKAELNFSRRDPTFIFVLRGELAGGGLRLTEDDALVISFDSGPGTKLVASPGTEILQVTLSRDLYDFFFAISVPTEREP